MYGKNFARPADQKIIFSSNGNAHKIELVAPRYFHDPETYSFSFDKSLNYSVLVDNGMANEGTKFKSFFPNAKIVRICYTDMSWPIVARTVVHKVLNKTLEQEAPPDKDKWPQNQSWAQREKWFLYLREHGLRKCWRPATQVVNVDLDQMLCYHELCNALLPIGVELDNFQDTWNQWRAANKLYIDPVLHAREIINDIKTNTYKKLDHVTDIWTQAILYYYIWIEFNQEVPHNDYADFFADTTQIRHWLKL
jgi:hypothetical protein